MHEIYFCWASAARTAVKTLVRGARPILLGGALMLYATQQAQAEAAQGLDNPTLSFNLTNATDYNSGMPFIDLMKMMRPWFARDADSNRISTDDLRAGNYLDADGWPTHIPDGVDGIGTQWEWSKFSTDIQDVRGRYVIEYEGTGTIKLGNDAKIISEEPGRIVFENLEGRAVFLKITETDPNGTGDYIRDISMVAEKNVALHDAGALFNPDWIDLIKDSRELRFMDWMDTNNSEITSWDQMPSADGPKTGGMMPIEYMVRLANETGVDPWFTMPHQADADYIRTFAIYVRDHLDPALTARVEYSNETWNWNFKQTVWMKQQAMAEWGVDAHRDYYAKMATQSALIWKDVFFGSNEDRLITVLGTQTAGTGATTKMLNPVNWREHEPDTYVDPKTVFDEVAVTTYFGGGVLKDDAFRTEILAAIQDPKQDANALMFARLTDPDYSQSIQSVMATLSTLAEIIHGAGMKMTAYEGGQHAHTLLNIKDMSAADGDLLQNFMTDFIRSKEMGDLYRDLWAGWSKVGDGAFMQFGSIGQSSKFGSWSLYDGLDDKTPRALALEELNRTSTPWWDGAKGGVQYQQGITATGTAEGDLMVGTVQEDYLLGEEGDDVFIAGRGNDGINGGKGVDMVVVSGVAADYTLKVEGKGYRLEGPDGSDFLINVEKIAFDDERVVTLANLTPNPDGSIDLAGLATTTPVIVVDTRSNGSHRPSVPSWEEQRGNKGENSVLISNGDDVLKGTASDDLMRGGVAEDRLRGGKGDDLMRGGRGDDILNGQQGDDVLRGGRGDDLILGRIGRDTLHGGANEDRMRGGRGDDVMFGGGGNDRMFAGLGNDQMTGGNGHDVMRGRRGDDILNGQQGDDVLRGGNGDDLIFGRIGNDTLHGGADEDRMKGGRGDDVMFGGGGNDQMMGGNGHDVLRGGRGDDLLTGGNGRDRFVFEHGSGSDRITDFQSNDTLYLRNFLAPDQAFDTSVSEVDAGLQITNGDDRVVLLGLHIEDLSWMNVQIS